MIDEKKLIEQLNESAFDMSLENPDCKAVWIDRAISIVNQLAEEYNNDVCEWKADEKFNWFIKSPHEGVGLTKEEHSMYKFCPYCGKKIKVVE